jgi:hypothetical protein
VVDGAEILKRLSKHRHNQKYCGLLLGQTRSPAGPEKSDKKRQFARVSFFPDAKKQKALSGSLFF